MRRDPPRPAYHRRDSRDREDYRSYHHSSRSHYSSAYHRRGPPPSESRYSRGGHHSSTTERRPHQEERAPKSEIPERQEAAQRRTVQGNFEQAARLYLQNLATSRRLGDRLEQVFTLSNLGELAFDREQWDEASHYLREGLEIAVTLNNTGRIAYILFWLGLLHAKQSEKTEYLSVSHFAAHHPDLPRYDQKFLQETLEQKKLNPDSVLDINTMAAQLNMEAAVQMFV